MKEKTSNLKYLIIFAIFIVVLAVLGSIYKITTEAARSNFRNNAFSVLFVSNDSKLIYVDKERKSAAFFALGDINKYVSGKNTLETSFALGVPINAIIMTDKPPVNLQDLTTYSNEFKLIFGSNYVFKNINTFDVHKVFTAIREADRDNRVEERIDIFNNDHLEKIEDEFLDTTIRNSGLSIEIKNGTSINGLGNLLALILSRQGYNVISVVTEKPDFNSYIAYQGEKNATVDSLVTFMGLDFLNQKKSQTADIAIYLGDDIDALLSD